MKSPAFLLVAIFATISVQAQNTGMGGSIPAGVLFPWLAGGMIFGMAVGAMAKRKQARLRAAPIRTRR